MDPKYDYCSLNSGYGPGSLKIDHIQKYFFVSWKELLPLALS